MKPLKKLIKKATKIVGYFEHSHLATKALENQQKRLKLPKHRLIQACATRWNSVYAMIKRLIEQKRAVIKVLNSNSVRKIQKLTNSDWINIQILVDVLKPFDEATTLMSAEKSVTISLVWPLIHNIRTNFLAQQDTDSTLIKKFKSTVSSQLSSRILAKTKVQVDGFVPCALLAEICGNFCNIILNIKL